ncbi:uncharacterized protein LOC133187950 [Saccostrea echinata]|uniref:uncharacterized protein LOC133187950 n=1 Tax=Saccostrea echinata TaxID=191078 RepID=UPI002A8216A6|nr:uncharacterized protein LOC133187950 [Saccostrea echinata]
MPTLTFVWTKEPCPHIQLWSARAKSFCDNPEWYHCLENQAGVIKEKCIAPRKIREGESEIIERRCPPSLYQPNGLMSNQYKSVTCMYEKDVCGDDGEEACDEGSDVSDRMCRCDFRKGYRAYEYLLENPKMKSCYQPRFKERGCVMLPCEKGRELNKAYQCVPVCPSGYYRSESDFNCVPRLSIPNPSTTTETPSKSSTINKQIEEPAMTDQDTDDNTATYVAIAVTTTSTLMILMFLGIYCYWKRKYYKETGFDKNRKPSVTSLISLEVDGGDGGENLHKPIGDSFPYSEIDVISEHNVKESIGCIKVEPHSGGKGNGTGFRVGEKYVMTAYHVVQDVYENFWKELHKRLKDGDHECKKLSKQFGNRKSTPEDGEWSLTNFIESLDTGTQMNLKDIGIEMVTHSCCITFGCVGEKKGESFTFSYDAPFISTKHDVAILELTTKPGHQFPAQLNFANFNTPANRLHVVGHPGGGELIFDPSCSVISDQIKLERTKEEAIKHFIFLGKTRSQVEKEYKECKLSSNHILFHCSKSTAHGASGSPLIRIANGNRKPEVIGVLLKGYPKMYYNDFLNNEKAIEHPELLIESGITVEMLKSLLKPHELSKLAQDIFS